MSRFDIRPPTGSLREAVFRFRYGVYVDEMQRNEPHADHGRQRLADPMDDTALILAATERGATSVVGTLRVNFLGAGGAECYERLYGLTTLTAGARASTSITTRLMIAPAHRGSLLAVELAKCAFAAGVAAGMIQDFIDCNPPLVPFFTRLGYRWIRTIEHPTYGTVNLMRLDGLDREHLARVRSPFLPVLKESNACTA